ncbi:uncharacterized protein LOC114357658 [Ostrinia furnacalis]|uniref:uncharacterized protein LOC114357658 n=1 Tax=Ostrinia furnacalis TaxID=93504 RepID=UPI00103A148A|nr:uncharacterized protein LOC114357658 [Ostrinia furnacalis]XP_028167185.1 uncharacterized protein LOC114357658 [Ostrinia furnacalis]
MESTESQNAQMEWDEEVTLKLIQLYQEKELLWNPNHSDHKSRPKRYEAWNEIAIILKTNVTEVERKIKNLTSQYYRERKKTVKSRKTGASTDCVYKSKWFAYKYFNFLLTKNKPAGTNDSETTSNDNGYITENSSSQTSHIPRANKRCKPNNEISEAINLIKTVGQQRNESKLRDEDELFGEYIATQLRKFEKTTKAIVKHRINNMIFEAETGYRADLFLPSPSTSTPHSHPSCYTSPIDQHVNSYYSSSNSALTNPVSPQTEVPVEENGDIKNIILSIDPDN